MAEWKPIHCGCCSALTGLLTRRFLDIFSALTVAELLLSAYCRIGHLKIRFTKRQLVSLVALQIQLTTHRLEKKCWWQIQCLSLNAVVFSWNVWKYPFMLKNSDRSAIALHNDIYSIINRLSTLSKNKRVGIGWLFTLESVYIEERG